MTRVTPVLVPVLMSLTLGYASSDDEDVGLLSKDAFGLSAIHATKKPKVTDVLPTPANAAPDVLSEVCQASLPYDSSLSTYAGPPETNISRYKTYRHSDEC